MSHVVGIDSTGIITSLLVKDHPKEMWYREAVQNAIEATQSYLKEKKIDSADIHIRKLHLKNLIQDENGNSVWKDKLSILNYGGMDSKQLMKALRLGGSGKIASLNANYGVGIKTSVLNWSDLLIITYKNGIGNFAWLGKEHTNGMDFNIVTYSGDGTGVEDCTDWIQDYADERGYELNHDFTEVVILGREVNQDTYLNTFGFGPDDAIEKKLKPTHIRENLCKRYFRLPENIKIKLHSSANNDSAKETITFMTFLEAFEKAKVNPKIIDKPLCESVTTNDGIDIHYFWDGPCGELFEKSDNNSTLMDLQTYSWQTTFSGFVWRDEIYDPKINYGRQWPTIAFRLGIQDNFNRFRIYVEYPDRAVITDKYRSKLQKQSGPETYEELDFASDDNLTMILANMPDWFKEKTKETKKEADASYDDKLANMFNKYMELNRQLTVKPLNGVGGTPKRGLTGDHVGQASPYNPTRQHRRSSVHRNLKNPKFDKPNFPLFYPASGDILKLLDKGNNFCQIELKAQDGRDVLWFNPEHRHVERLASAVIKNLDPTEYLELTKDKIKDEFVLQSALWLMICQSRMSEEMMTYEEMTTVIKPDFIDTYLLSRELEIFEEVSKDINKEARKRSTLLIPGDNLEDTFNMTADSDSSISDLEKRLVAVGGKLPIEESNE